MLIKLLIILGKRHWKVTQFIDRYIQKCSKIYTFGYWAQFGVREYPLAFEVDGLPYVFNYNDHNGTYSEWEVIPIYYTTTGQIIEWSKDGEALKLKCAKLNSKLQGDL